MGTVTTTLPNRWSVPEHRGEVGLLPPFLLVWTWRLGDHFSAFRETSTPPPNFPTPTYPCLQGEPGQMGSVFDKGTLPPCFNALLLHFKSSTVFSKCWNWQLCQSLATLNNPPFKSGSANPDSVESCDGAHREPLPSTVRRVRVMSCSKIPKGRIQQSSYTASIILVSQGGFTN